MGKTFDVVLTVAALVIGVMMFFGKGDLFLSDKNAAEREKKYDMTKAQRGFGVMLIVVGIATGISMLFDSTISYAIYMVVIILAFVGGFFYMRKFCQK